MVNDKIKEKLEKYPEYRERKKKNLLIAKMLAFKYSLETTLPVEILESIVADSSTYDRAWRKILQENVNLRGKDYEEKEILEQEKQIELGYQPGIKRSIKKVKEITQEITKPYKD